VIGGSGFTRFEGDVVHQQHLESGKYGATSDAISSMEVDGQQVFFLARHGKDQAIAPHLINYRANLWALHELGVKRVLAVNACGGIHPSFSVGDLVIPKQIIDYSVGRESTFYDGVMAPLDHIDFTYPFSECLRGMLSQAATQSQRTLHDFGVYGCTQGPRLETAAEIERLKRDGCDLVGMTVMPEAVLARELGMDYASICMIVNPAAGLGKEGAELGIEEIKKQCREMAVDIQKIVIAGITALET